MYELIVGQRANSGKFTKSDIPVLSLGSGHQGRMTLNTHAVEVLRLKVADKIQFFADKEKGTVAFKKVKKTQISDFCTLQPWRSNHSLRLTSKPISIIIREVYKIKDLRGQKFVIELNGEFCELKLI